MPIKKWFIKRNPTEQANLQSLLKQQEERIQALEARIQQLAKEAPQAKPASSQLSQLKPLVQGQIQSHIHALEKQLQMQLRDTLGAHARRLAELEERLFRLEAGLTALDSTVQQVQLALEVLNNREHGAVQPPVILQEIHVDTLIVDKYELNNNIAQLGVHDLGGSLVIGASYGKGSPSAEWQEDMEQLKQKSQDVEQGKQTQGAASDDDTDPPFEPVPVQE
ncbi:hypothetical protein [Ectobacillus ponti]|uniref:Uncharacterized protein n=1 Tax=Ectobacillus ponti TaxID=2961894 RepID=A0AA42BN27_9BACI|nr:hypothetical protein [Ectobacillus ponti]MCP8967227.1 hypothetical protein [Ectobacillus ponti]